MALKVVVLKGRDFSSAAKWSNINVALATEGIFPRRNGLFSAPFSSPLYCIWTSPIQLANGGSVIEVEVAPINDGSLLSSVLIAVC
jgi:hypothetical protein